MSIKIDNFIICPVEKLVQLALNIGLDSAQSIKLANELVTLECAKSADIKGFYQMRINISKSREIKKKNNWITGTDSKGTRAF